MDFNEIKAKYQREAHAAAELYGITGGGHNSPLDAFRHTYSFAMARYRNGLAVAAGAGEIDESYGDYFKNQPYRERLMDTHNNQIGIRIGAEVSNESEIAPAVYQALMEGALITNLDDSRIEDDYIRDIPDRPLGGFNDDQYTLPKDGSPPQFPMPQSHGSPAPTENGFFSSIGGFLSGIGSGIADFFGGGSNVGSAPFNPFPKRDYKSASGISPADLMRHQLAQRESKVDIDKILSDAVAKNADSLVDRLLAKNPNMFEKTLGRVLTSSLETFTSEIRKSKTRSFEEAFSNVFSGQSGQQIASNIGTMAAGEIINYGIDEIFYKERTRVRMQETERSRRERESLRLSEGQQAAALLRAIQKGQRNL